MTIIVLSLLACVIPTLLYVGLIYWVDQYEKEPLWLLSAVFLWGAFPAIILALLLNSLLSVPISEFVGPELGKVATLLVIAPFGEEAAKGLALVGIMLWRHNEIDTILDGIIYGAMTGMGFAMVENFIYFVDQFEKGGLTAWGINVFLRAGFFGLNHALFTGLMGLGIAIAILSKREIIRITMPFIGWIAATSMHILHNILVSTVLFLAPITIWSSVLFTIVIIVWVLMQEQAWLKTYLQDEVMLGTLTPTQYELVISRKQRNALLWDLFSHFKWGQYRRTRQFLRDCSKLAYKKHHMDVHPEDRMDLAGLRNEVRLLSHAI